MATSFVSRSAVVARPAVSAARPSAARAVVSPRPVATMRAAPPSQLDAKIQEALSAADAACDDKGVKSTDCAVAWDQAEELLAAKAHKRVVDEANSDPLENFCKDAPDADECRVHEL